jgi:hypothetical protein
VDKTKPTSVEPGFDAGGTFLNGPNWCP